MTIHCILDNNTAKIPSYGNSQACNVNWNNAILPTGTAFCVLDPNRCQASSSIRNFIIPTHLYNFLTVPNSGPEVFNSLDWN